MQNNNLLFVCFVLIALTSTVARRMKRQVSEVPLKESQTTTAIETTLVVANEITTSATSTTTNGTIQFDINSSTTATTTQVIPFTPTQTTTPVTLTISTNAETTTYPTPTVNDTVNFTQIIELLGPRKKVDVVFILSRSQSVGKRSFYEKSRYIMRTLLQLYATVHTDYTRIAAISYASNYTVDYDDISGDDNHEPLDKCQLFPSNQQKSFPLDNLKYRKDDDHMTCGIFEAYERTTDILRKGKIIRPDAVQIVVLLADAIGSCTFKPLSLDKTSVKVFGVGVGAFLNEVAMNSFVSSPFSSFAATIDFWINITEKAVTIKRVTPPLFVEIKQNISCGSFNSKCFCNIDDGTIKACNSETECSNVVLPILTCSISGPNQCDQGPCLNMPYGFFCNCRENFYGQYCQYYADPCRFSDICDVNGECQGIPTNGGQFRCMCTPAYEGDFCQDLKPTTVTTPAPLNVTRIVTIVHSVTPVPFDITKSIILGSVFGGLALLAIIVGITLCIIFYIARRKVLRNEASYKSNSMSTTGVQSTIRSLTGSKYGNVSTRISQLFSNGRSGAGFPSVPSRFSASLSAIDMQNVSQEETVFRNEVIQDNRQMLKNWKLYLDELVKKRILEKAVMINTLTKEAINTEKWNVDLNELNFLESSIEYDTQASIQGDNYFLTVSGINFMSGKEIFTTRSDPKFACVGRTKTYLIVGIAGSSHDEETEECKREIQYIVKHISAEGF